MYMRDQKMIGAHMGRAWALLVGRITYEDLYGHWTKLPPNPMSDALDREIRRINHAADAASPAKFDPAGSPWPTAGSFLYFRLSRIRQA